MLRQSIFLILNVVLAANASPFQLTDQYVEEFHKGLEELKKLSKEYVFTQQDFVGSAENEEQAIAEASEFDFIIVGGGSSGSVVANRLSEVPEWKILLLEAGNAESKISKTPSAQKYLENTPYNWNFHTVAQNKSCLASEHQQCHLSMGKALGGTTSINSMLYNRGNHKDYDLWADLHNDGWCWNDVFPYFKKIEDAHIDNLDRKYHNLGGPLHLEEFQHSTGLAPHIFEAAHHLEVETVDYNGKDQLGVSVPQAYTKNGQRNGVAQAYLAPASKRQNLVIKTQSQAVKVLIGPHTKEVSGVLYAHDGHLFAAKASKEVILAAGAVKTPQLLVLSGVGLKEDLERLEIPPVCDLKVGHNLKDHIGFFGLNFIFNETSKEEHKDYDSVVDYLKNGKGPLTSVGLEAVGYLKSESSKDKGHYPDVGILVTKDIFNKGIDHLKHLAITKDIYDHVWAPLEGHEGFSIIVTLLHPKSTGVLTLHDKDPLHQPLINPNYFSDEEDHDLETMVSGIRKVLKLAQTEPLHKLGIQLNHNKVPGCENYEEDHYWRCAIKHLSFSLSDLSGTAKMGLESDKEAVVDNNLKVHGVHKLRVADSSVIPVSISGDLTAAKIMIGEKAADLIRHDWK